MKISYNWLKEHIDIQESPDEIAELLTKSGLEVESVEEYEKVKGGLKGVVVGEVLTCEKHPGADKLKKTTVDLGNGTIVPVVCGAPNVAAGQKVLVATVGAMLYPSEGEPIKISKAKIRGEVSEGMICAEDELGIGKDHDGIMVLTTDLPAGTPASAYLGNSSDYILEIGLTPNRGDAASHLGVARDLKALLQRPLKFTDSNLPEGNGADFEVEIIDQEACIRYTGLTITGLKISDSPEWLKEKLRCIGLSPINNVVDITNYVLHDLGQPLHAFDLEKVKGNKIRIGTVAQGTEFETLDGQKRKLNSTDLMILNEQEPMCIAGVFGGANSGVTDSTTSIFLESACFSPDSVRKTAMKHALKTDSSFRFERGTDPRIPPFALKKAADLILEIAGGKVSSKIIDLYPNPVKDFLVTTSFSRIQKLAGKEISKLEIKRILRDLDIQIAREEEDKLEVSVPPYRVDVSREADVVEEVLRIYGYDNIEISDRISAGYLADFPEKETDKIQAQISMLLTARGFNEIITNSLTKPQYSKLSGTDGSAIEILNKLSEDLGVMRQSLLSSGLEIVAYNVNRRQKDLKFFEFGKTYFKQEDKYKEPRRLALFISGGKVEESWMADSANAGFFDLKQTVEDIIKKMNLKSVDSSPIQNNPEFKYGLEYILNGKTLVSFGIVSDTYLKASDLKQQVLYAWFDLDLLYKSYKSTVLFEEISRFPEVRRDLSLVLDKGITFAQIREQALKIEKKLVKSINVFDVYEGKNIGEGKKSYSISFIIQDYQKTLTDDVIDKTMEKMMNAFEKELGAIIRK